MTILAAVKKNNRVYIGADRITMFGGEYATDLVDNCKIMKLRHAYLASSGYTLVNNVIEHLYSKGSEILDNEFRNRADVFQFFLALYGQLKDNYTLVDSGKDTYAAIYNSFLLVTPGHIYGIANNLSVHEYDQYAAYGAGADYALGSLYSIYDVLDDGEEITRVALEAACQFSIYCKEPLDILEVKESELAKKRRGVFKPSQSEISTRLAKQGMTKYKFTQKRGSQTRKSSKSSTTQVRRKQTTKAKKKS